MPFKAKNSNYIVMVPGFFAEEIADTVFITPKCSEILNCIELKFLQSQRTVFYLAAIVTVFLNACTQLHDK